jgi:quercetin dioxygenase-like cupin family protein
MSLRVTFKPRSQIAVHLTEEHIVKYTRSREQTAVGPQDWFTGDVYIDGIRNPDDQSAVGCAHVRFAPGARTAWHHHPKGQTLYVTDGVGLVATREDVHEIRPGDVVYIEPNEEHWHGATPGRFMAHVAIQEADDQGQVVTWLDSVADADYQQAAKTTG